MSDAYTRLMARTKPGPVVRPELGPCLDSTYRDNGLGYVQVKDRGRSVVGSRVVLEHKLGRSLREGMYALHKCDRRCCLNEDHLYEGTYAQNARDRAERNPSSFIRGEAHVRSKLTVALVWDIRESVRLGRSVNGTATDFRLPRSTVRNVIIGRTWGHIPARPLPSRDILAK